METSEEIRTEDIRSFKYVGDTITLNINENIYRRKRKQNVRKPIDLNHF